MATTRSQIRKNKTIRSHIRYVFERYIRPFLFIAGGLLLVAWLGAWLWLGGYIQKASDFLHEQYLEATLSLGFEVKEVLIEGRDNTDADALRAIINVRPGDPMMSFNPDTARSLIEKISWVKSVRVERRFPSTLYIHLYERIPAAFWKEGERNVVIDQDGVVLDNKDLTRFGDLIQLYGEGANEQVANLFEYLKGQPDIAEKVIGAAWINERRWDVLFNNGIRAKFPETDFGLALAALAKANKHEKLLERNIKEIDLRQTGRIIIKTERGQLEDLIPLISSE